MPDDRSKFAALNAEIVGISVDPPGRVTRRCVEIGRLAIDTSRTLGALQRLAQSK